MSEPFRTRSFIPVKPELRPRRQRRAVRLIVRAGDRVLLFADTDPGVPGSEWWVTPGGGVDPGESVEQAAVRELREESGYEADVDHLIGPVAYRTVAHGYSDQVLEQDETFFVINVDRFEVSTAGHTAEEKITLSGFRWWPVQELPYWNVWPQAIKLIIDAADHPTTWPLDLGYTDDESTVPVTPGR